MKIIPMYPIHPLLVIFNILQPENLTYTYTLPNNPNILKDLRNED